MFQLQDNGDIVISGFEKGIGDSPYVGLTDLKSVNIASIPGEASVSFSSSSVTKAPTYTGITVTADGAGNILATGLTQNHLMETGQAISFGTSSIAHATAGTLFYIAGASQQSSTSEIISITTTYGSTSGISLGTSGTATLSVSPIGLPNYFQKSRGNNFMVDANGRVWSDKVVTSGGTGGITSTASWTYTGNSLDASSNGNGLLVFTTVHDGTGGATSATFDEWLFVWRNSQIDYTQLTANSTATNISWVNGWNYKVGTNGNTQYLNTNSTVANPHPALVTPDARANFCDGNYIGNFYQNIPSPGSNYVGFNPANIATYTPQTITAVLPPSDTGQCLAFVNQYLLIGGRGNIVYPWDMNPADNTYSTPLIQLPEVGIAAIVTVGNNGYIFAGNRGNIYITNGSQASFYKKVPDHISGSPEPLFSWGNGVMTAGCAAYTKRRIYFGCNAQLQAGGTATGYGGLWCLDVDKATIFNAQQMSYGNYSGYVSAVGMSTANSAGGVSYGPNIGYGLLCGWSDAGIPTFGIDADIALPYAGGQSIIISDAIPIGTLLKPQTPYQVEFKLAAPMTANESVELLISSYPTGTFTSCTIVSGSTSSTVISGNKGLPVSGIQWALLKAVLTSTTGATPSYNRVTELRFIESQK